MVISPLLQSSLFITNNCTAVHRFVLCSKPVVCYHDSKKLTTVVAVVVAVVAAAAAVVVVA